MRLLSSLFAVLAAAQAAVACPTAADLDRGIRMDLSSGEWEIFKRRSATVIESQFFLDEREAIRVLLAKGIYMVEIADLSNGDLVPGTREVFAYPVSHNRMPDPAEGGGWSLSVALRGDYGLDTEHQNYTFGSPRPYQIGACRYQMIPITFRFEVESERVPYVDVLHYFPELGLSYLASAADEGGTPDVYEYVSIYALD